MCTEVEMKINRHNYVPHKGSSLVMCRYNYTRDALHLHTFELCVSECPLIKGAHILCTYVVDGGLQQVVM